MKKLLFLIPLFGLVAGCNKCGTSGKDAGAAPTNAPPAEAKAAVEATPAPAAPTNAAPAAVQAPADATPAPAAPEAPKAP